MMPLMFIQSEPHLAAWSDRIRTSPFAWLLAGLLLVAAVYFLIRLLESDLMNEETDDQEDPLLK